MLPESDCEIVWKPAVENRVFLNFLKREKLYATI